MQVGDGGGDSADLRGRHRIQAELKKLEQEARFLESKTLLILLHQMIGDSVLKTETSDEACAIECRRNLKSSIKRIRYHLRCKSNFYMACCWRLTGLFYVARFLIAMERKADPLLPVSAGPVNQSWDRWFEGPQDLRGCKCWFL
ncbi:AGG2 [Zea mays]|uniref:AGG2 n=1 Tax=Zea mays TaxID=4577 RepID=A0A1D6KXG0_MAIZE|nr:AGG2 [Zea mays]